MEDTLYKFLKLYNSSPIFIKKIVGYLYNFLPNNLRYGKFYNKYLERIKSYYDRNFDFNNEFLKQINYSIRNIDYYKNYNICETLDDFKKIPIIDKHIIRRNKDRFINKNLLNVAIKCNTGGSSGTPLDFYLEKGVSRSKEKAHFDWYWGLYGYKKKSKILMVRGNPLKNNRLYEYQSIDNKLAISCYNINENNITEVIAQINRYKPKFIHAYPSALNILTKYIQGNENRLNINIKAVFLGSEGLAESDRLFFEKMYDAYIVSWYGHSERLIHGGNCPYSDEYHFYPFYGHIELVDEHGNEITTPGIIGRIIATGLDNKVMPFIRYDTEDLGVLSEKKECKCGFKGLTLKRIEGRKQDFVILSDGTRVSTTAFVFGQHLDAFNKIIEIQIIQNEIGVIRILIVKTKYYNETDEISLKKILLLSVNNKLEISFEYPLNIKKTDNGKHRFLIQNLLEF